MEKLADIVSSDKVTSFEDELLESSEFIPQRTASAKVAVETTDATLEDNNHHASTHAGKSLTSPLLEDLDSFNLIEPPPLDWRSDSSSECSLDEFRDIDEPGSSHTDSMEVPLEEVSDYGAQNTSFTLALPPSEMEGVINQEMGMNEPDTLENSPEEKREEKPGEEHRQRDMDHSHIQTLLTQLQLFHPTPSPKETAQEAEPEQSTSSPDALTDRDASQCAAPEVNTYHTCPEGSIASGLLFTESHQRDLLQLLEDPEPLEPQPVYTAQTNENNIEHVSQLIDSQTRYTAQSVEADEVVSVSYGQETWHSPFQDEFMVSGYSEDEVLAQWRQSKGLSLDEIPCHTADVDAEAEAQPSYKDVPGPCDPEDLLDGVIFGAKYLGSTQLQSDKNPSTNARMAQAQEAVDRIKAPDGESQPMTEVDLFISTQRIKVLSADTQEAMMDHPLQMISYIADIGSVVVLMARRKPAVHKPLDTAASLQHTSAPPTKCWMICHVFSSEDAQTIAQAIGQAFGVAYQQFLQENGIKAGELRPGEYSDYLGTQELYNGDLVHFSRSENIREVCITKQVGEILGLAVVESGWGSILPTVVVANLLHGGPAERSGELSIGDRIMSVNGTSLVGLPITTCHNIIRDLKSQSQVKLSIVHCPPVTMAIIKRPDPKYQLGFSVEDGIICSLMRGGIAERGGIRVGHRIIEINGQSVVATPHEKIIQILSNAVGEIHLKTMPTSTYRLLTGQEQPVFL